MKKCTIFIVSLRCWIFGWLACAIIIHFFTNPDHSFMTQQEKLLRPLLIAGGLLLVWGWTKLFRNMIALLRYTQAPLSNPYMWLFLYAGTLLFFVHQVVLFFTGFVFLSLIAVMILVNTYAANPRP
ncbi:MAG: hypothetical protein MJ053_02595 [Elusimicrobiaceae bacterium]|nr:hypothetical protein [Elusimicrobiaceae bacterium]